MKNKQRLLKPRNPHLVQMVKRKSGAHVKSSKALRRGEKSRKLLDSDN
jgi:hypothetical protein